MKTFERHEQRLETVCFPIFNTFPIAKKSYHCFEFFFSEFGVDILRAGCKKRKNGVYSLKWRLTDRYPRWGTLACPRLGRAEADQCKSSEFLQELRISGFPRF